MGEFQVVKTQEDYCREYKCGVFDLPYQITTDKSFQAMGHHRVYDHPEAKAIIHALSPEMVWPCVEALDVLDVGIRCEVGISMKGGVTSPWTLNGYRSGWDLYRNFRIVRGTSLYDDVDVSAEILKRSLGSATLLIYAHSHKTSLRYDLVASLHESAAGARMLEKIANPSFPLQISAKPDGYVYNVLGLVELTWDPDFKDLPNSEGDLAESITRTSLQVEIAR